MLNEPDAKKKTQLTRSWVRHMVEHLNIMIITASTFRLHMLSTLTNVTPKSSVVSSVVAGAFSWACFSEYPDSTCIVIVKALWYGALVFSISAIAAAAQQITSLHRLDLYPGGLQTIRQLLGEPRNAAASPAAPGRTATPAIQLKFSQRVLWQIPVMLLNGSLYLFTAGLCVLAFWDFTRSFGDSIQSVEVSHFS